MTRPRFMLLLLALATGAPADEATERARIAADYKATLAELCPEAAAVTDAEVSLMLVPRETFDRLLAVISGEARVDPYANSVMGERIKALRAQEKRDGDTLIVRMKWLDLHWAWRALLDGLTPTTSP